MEGGKKADALKRHDAARDYVLHSKEVGHSQGKVC